jgi:hypothetical protein
LKAEDVVPLKTELIKALNGAKAVSEAVAPLKAALREELSIPLKEADAQLKVLNRELIIATGLVAPSRVVNLLYAVASNAVIVKDLVSKLIIELNAELKAAALEAAEAAEAAKAAEAAAREATSGAACKAELDAAEAAVRKVALEAESCNAVLEKKQLDYVKRSVSYHLRLCNGEIQLKTLEESECIASPVSPENSSLFVPTSNNSDNISDMLVRFDKLAEFSPDLPHIEIRLEYKRVTSPSQNRQQLLWST